MNILKTTAVFALVILTAACAGRQPSGGDYTSTSQAQNAVKMDCVVTSQNGYVTERCTGRYTKSVPAPKTQNYLGNGRYYTVRGHLGLGAHAGSRWSW